VDQDPILFNTTIAENIAYGTPDATSDEIIEAAVKANANGFIMELPNGYQTQVGEHGHLLSAGQKKRLAIARAMLVDYKVLLLDEFTNELDMETEKLVREAMDRLSQGKTVIMISHRLTTVRDCECIFVINQGQLVQKGRHQVLMRRDGMYRRLAQVQLAADENFKKLSLKRMIIGDRTKPKKEKSLRPKEVETDGATSLELTINSDQLTEINNIEGPSVEDPHHSEEDTHNHSDDQHSDIDESEVHNEKENNSTLEGPSFEDVHHSDSDIDIELPPTQHIAREVSKTYSEDEEFLPLSPRSPRSLVDTFLFRKDSGHF